MKEKCTIIISNAPRPERPAQSRKGKEKQAPHALVLLMERCDWSLLTRACGHDVFVDSFHVGLRHGGRMVPSTSVAAGHVFQ